MRLIHTSDWHLGQSFHAHSRRYEHDRFLGWLLETLEEEQADVLLIAGDIFDTANPSAEAQGQFYGFLRDAAARLPGLSIIGIAGNHDSGARLEAPAPLFDAVNATFIGLVPRGEEGRCRAEDLVVPLKRRDGSLAGHCLAVPYLRPSDVEVGPATATSLADGVRELYAAAMAVAEQRRQPGQALVALGHCHAAGGWLCDSERPLVIGGAEALPVATFPEALNYVALGHLHRAQTVGNKAHVRYSGSPLPLSFSEQPYDHQVLRVDFEDGAVARLQSLHVPRSVELLRVPDEPRPIDEVVTALVALKLEARPEAERPYLQVRVRVDGPDLTRVRRIEEALHGRPIRLARIEAVSAPTASPAEALSPVSLDELTSLQPESIFADLYQRKYGQPPPPELATAFTELVHEAQQVAP